MKTIEDGCAPLEDMAQASKAQRIECVSFEAFIVASDGTKRQIHAAHDFHAAALAGMSPDEAKQHAATVARSGQVTGDITIAGHLEPAPRRRKNPLLALMSLGLICPWDSAPWCVPYAERQRERAPSLIERVDRQLPRVALPPERPSKRARRRARGKEGRRG